MKRFFFMIFFIFAPIFIFAQSFLSHYVSYIGKTVPNGFSRIDETTYTNNEIILKVKNNIVISSGWAEEYNNINEADLYYIGYCNLFENTNWTFFQRDLHCDVYKYANIYVVCTKPQFRIDGVYVIMVTFYSGEFSDCHLFSQN